MIRGKWSVAKSLASGGIFRLAARASISDVIWCKKYSRKPASSLSVHAQIGARRARRLCTPLFKLLFGLFFSYAVFLLELAQKLILFAGYYVKIIVRELAPPLLHRTFELIPSTLYLFPVHIHLVAVHAFRHSLWKLDVRT